MEQTASTMKNAAIALKKKQAQRQAVADRSQHKSQARIQYQGPYFPI